MNRRPAYILVVLSVSLLAFPALTVELSSDLTKKEEAELALDDSVRKAESRRLQTLLDNIRLALVNEDTAGAAEFFRRALISSLDREDSRTARIERYGYDIALSFVSSEKYKDGLRFADDLLNVTGDDSRVFHIKALAYAGLGDEGKAADWTEKALSLNPEDAAYHLDAGRYFLDNKRLEVAAAELSRALELAEEGSETEANANLHLGRTAYRNRKFEDCARYYRQVADFLSRNDALYADENRSIVGEIIQAHITLAREYELAGEYQKEVEALKAAQGYFPQYPYLLNALGSVLTRTGMYEEAEMSFMNCVAVFEEFSDAYVGYGDLMLKQGRKDDAERLFEKGVNLYKKEIEARADDEDVATALNNLAWFYATHDRELVEGLRFSKRSLELRPDEPAYLDTLAELYYRKGDKAKAIETIKKAIDKDPIHPIYYKQQLSKFEEKTGTGSDKPE